MYIPGRKRLSVILKTISSFCLTLPHIAIFSHPTSNCFTI